METNVIPIALKQNVVQMEIEERKGKNRGSFVEKWTKIMVGTALRQEKYYFFRRNIVPWLGVQSIFLYVHMNIFQQLAVMALRIKEKMTSTVEDRVLRVQLAMMVFKIKKKLTSTVEDHVLRAQRVMIVFRIKGKLLLIVEDHVLNAMVKGLGSNDIIIIEQIL